MQDTKDIIPILWNNRKVIISVSVVAMILSALFSLMLPNYYQATTLFYPVSENLQKPIVFANDESLSFFGNDHDVDRLLSIGQSREIKKRIISEFNLMEHYEIDESDSKSMLKVSKKFDKLYTVMKTNLDAIEVAIEDIEPELSAQMCNRVRELIEQKALELTSQARNELQKSMEAEVDLKEAELKQLTSEIQSIREQYGIYDTQSQAEGLATLQAKSPNSKSVQAAIDNYVRGVSDIKKLEIQQEELAKIITYDRNQLKQLKSSQNRQLSAIHIIEQAEAPLEKSRPKRSLIVIGIGVFTGVFMYLWFLIRRSLNTLDFSVR